jgi:hypothetical protein
MGVMENGAFDSRKIMPICLPEDAQFKVKISLIVVIISHKYLKNFMWTIS